MESNHIKICACTGIRFCKDCEDPDFRQHFKELYPVIKSEDHVIITYQQCLKCEKYTADLQYQNCDSHIYLSQLDFEGFFTIDNFITEQQEQQFTQEINSYQWVESQSGRRKIDFGPQANFKKKKVKIGKFSGLPLFINPVLQQLQKVSDTSISQILEGFLPIELNVLQYDEERGSNIDPHFDDFWLWGERIVGINMLQQSKMTFTKQIYQQQTIEIQIPLKKQQLYLLSGKSRFEWMHGIKKEHIIGKRMVFTIREFSKEFQDQSNEIGNKVRKIASQLF